MPEPLVCIHKNGAVCLGPTVVCDGFSKKRRFRVQTHVHTDHMGQFDKSKGFQDFLLTPETYELLVADLNADIEYRNNFRCIPCGHEFFLCDDGSKITFQRSNHMLGSCQVALENADGSRIGYSSDFGWPLENVIQVDTLALDSTYGKPTSIRNYTQAQAEEELVNIVCHRLRHGPVHIYANRGTIERALHVLSGEVTVPILATKRRIREINVYQRYGLAIGELIDIESKQARLIVNEHSYIQLYAQGDSRPNDPPNGTAVCCSAYLTSPEQPSRQLSDRSYVVALTNHADFNGTLDYIEATNATTVITDNTRSYGCELARAINARFPKVRAVPSPNYGI